MKNTTKRARAWLVSLLSVLMLCCLFIAVGIGTSAADTLITDAPLTAGRSFEDGEGIQLGKDLDTMPRTYEAVVYVPADVNQKGAILSNFYPLGNTPHIDFAIINGGTNGAEARPLLDITDVNNNRTRVEFRKDVKAEGWMHVVITHESNEDGDVYTCYVNGEKVSKSNINIWIDGTKNNEAIVTYGEMDMSGMENSASMYLGQAYAYSSVTELGADDPYNDGGAYEPTNFKGRIKNVALYSTVLTEAEIKANYQSGINVSRDDIILCYDLTSEETSGETKSGYITDISGNGYNTVPLFHEREDEISGDDFDYAFAVLGDTQFLVDRDVAMGTSYTADIYNWIIANKDAKKIARVLGVGDIVEDGNIYEKVSDEVRARAQWTYAVAQFARLEEAGIPYTITWGFNHDGQKGQEFTEYFASSTNFTDSDIGYFISDSTHADYNKRLANYYQRFEVDAKGESGEDIKIGYLVMCIEYRPSDAVLSWADSVIKANADSRVIISTHYFLNQHGEISEEYAEIQPKWDRLANENKNVELILSGHVARQNNIVKAYTVAKSGQTVAQLLIDPQQMDRFYGYDDTGVVVMLYFSNQGNDVRVELVSTAKTMRAREAAEAEGKNPDEVTDILYGKRNEFTYNLKTVEAPVETEYGVIPAEYASEDEYPFVLFDSNKNWIGAAMQLYGAKLDTMAVGKAKDYLKRNTWSGGSYGKGEISVIILMRRDVVMAADEEYYNIAQAKGNIIIDLNGKTLTAPSSKHLFNLAHKAAPTAYGQTIFNTALTVKNGAVSISNGYLVNYSISDNGEGKHFTCVFDNVDFKVTGSASKLVNVGGSKYEFNPTVKFDNCDFDLSDASQKVTLCYLGTNTISVHYTVIGGEIKGGASGCKIAVGADVNRGSATVKANADKQYPYLILPSGVSVTTEKLNGGSHYFKKVSGTDEITYKLYTKLGNYGEVSADDTEYAFLVFDGNNKLKYKSDELYGNAASTSAINRAKENILKENRWVLQADGTYAYEGKNSGDAPVTCTILMMRDYTMGEYEAYSNLSQIQGVLTIDLNGHTLSANETETLFPTSLKKWTSSGDAEIFPSQITLKNGKIDVYNHAIITFANNTNGNGKEFTYRFEDVEIFAKGTASSVIADQPGTASVTYKTALELVNCKIDISGSLASGAVTLFNLGSKTTNTNARVYGGSIVSGNKEFKLWEKASGSGTIVFYKSEGAYTVMSSGGFAPAESVTTEEGIECVFIKKNATAGTVTFVLCPEVMANYKIKTSVTLHTNFVYNIYVPVSNAKSFTVNGGAVEYRTEVIDGTEYYCIAVDLPAGEALSDIALKVTLYAGDKTVDVNWTLSILKYTKSILSGKFGDTTKTLMKDMLVYAAAAHTYFENELDGEKKSEIEALLSGYVREMPEGEAKKPLDTTYFTDVAVYVGDVPSFRFYLADGYSAEDFTFTAGKRSVSSREGVDKNGKYLEVTMYAYMMLDDVTYTVTDKESGVSVSESYNLYAYLDFAKNENDPKLTAVVEGLMKYSASAKEYRESVLNKNAVSAEIVNKNGASGAVSFVVDDGDQTTASFLQEMMIKYPTLALTFAVPVKKLATLAIEDKDGNGIPNYVMVDGKYVYEVNEESYAFWCDILSSGNAEIVNHSYTHGYFGSNDNGGSFEYVKNNSSEVTTSEVLPEGSVSKEIYASKQILEELFADYISDNNTMVSYIGAGIGVRTSDFTLADGTVITTYKTFLDGALKEAYENGEVVAVNTTFGQYYSASLDVSTKVVLAEKFDEALRLKIPRYMIESYNANPEGLVNGDISNWTEFIDAAAELNGWACFCIHKIRENAPESTSDHIITEAQAEALLKYAVENNLWIATNTEVALYFSEWSTASVITELVNGEIRVTVTDEEDDSIYNMALTVKVNLPDGWESAEVGGKSCEIFRNEDGSAYVLVDIVPDTECAVITQGN